MIASASPNPNGAKEKVVTLSNFWGWHFDTVLEDLHATLVDEFRLLKDELGVEPPVRLELFRRSWPSSEDDCFWFRWCFFDRRAGDPLGRLETWRSNATARAFVNYLSRPGILEHFAQGTQYHIAHLRDSFFSPESDAAEFLEDWRAVYLQTPTRGTILPQLWLKAREQEQETSVFVVKPDAVLEGQEDFEFPPFSFWPVSETGPKTRSIYIARQEPIGLLKTSASAQELSDAARFFQSGPYLYFFDPTYLTGGTKGLHQKMDLALFLFIPIYLGRKNEPKEWIGVLQISFAKQSGATSCLAPDDIDILLQGEAVCSSLCRIAKMTQSLWHDLLLAHVQEQYDRPFTSRKEINELRDKGISTILGPEAREKTHPKTFPQLTRLFDFEAERAYNKITLGEGLGDERRSSSFAHLTSAALDSIVQSFGLLPRPMRAAMGATLLAKLYLLRITINSYRTEGTAVNLGPFAYPWQPNDCPLKVYCDIGIQLGLARAENARPDEQIVRKAGRAALQPENQPGQEGFETYWSLLFKEKPKEELNSATKQHIMHSSFAGLIILVLKQAVYHTLRARLVKNQAGRITITLPSPSCGAVVECRIENPEVNKEHRETTARDVGELAELAKQLSEIPGDPSMYSVEGPSFDKVSGRWATTIRVFEKLNLDGN